MKKTGKVLSLVLSLALVASSLTATFASAASSETATIDLTTESIALVNGGVENDTTHTLTSPNLVDSKYLTGFETAELYDHSNVSTELNVKDVAITSGSDKAKLVKVDTDDDGYLDNVQLVLKSASVSGTVTLAVRYEGTVSRAEDDDTKIYGTTTFTATIYEADKAYISGKASDPATDPADLGTLARNSSEDDSTNIVNGVVETPKVGTDASANWTPVASSLSKTKPEDSTTTVEEEQKKYVLSVSGSADVDPGTGDGTFTLKNQADAGELASAGKVSVRVDEYTAGVGDKTEYKVTDHLTAKTTIDNKYLAQTGETKISKYSSSTYIGNAEATSTNKGTLKNITGSDIVLAGDTTISGGKIGNVTGTGALTVEDGSVGDVDITGNVVIEDGTVGDVTVGTGETLTVKGGVVGDIDGAGTVSIEPTDEETPIKTGAISATKVSADSNDTAAVTLGDITLAANGEVTLTGDDVKVGKIDGDYRSAALTLNDFKGSISAPAHGYTEGLESESHLTLNVTGEDSNVTVTGNASIYEISLDDSASLTFADKVDVGEGGAHGDGTLKFAPNALYTTGDITTSIRLTKAFKAGDVVFTAATDAVDENDFTGVGFTAEKVAASTTKDAFKVKEAEFASLEIQGSSKIPVGTTENYTAAAYPEGTTLPEGYYVQWEFSGNSDYLLATADPDDSTKISVKAIKADDTFASLNKGTLTAYVVDEDGFEDYAYPEATFDVSIGAKPSAYTSDTHGTYNMLLGQSYTFKITASDGSVPPFVVAYDGAKVAPYTKSGNDYFFKVTGAKVGDYGVYVGDKVCILHITDVKTDTTKVTIKDGASYVFKITKGEAASAPYFVVAGQGVVLPVDVRGNDYFYKVTNNGRTGDVGVYVNGPKIAVITFTK